MGSVLLLGSQPASPARGRDWGGWVVDDPAHVLGAQTYQRVVGCFRDRKRVPHFVAVNRSGPGPRPAQVSAGPD
jgi:hypothetical protein